MTVTARYIADGALIKLNQATGGTSTRYTDAEALRFLNDAQRAIVLLARNANPKRVVATPVSGSSRQTLSDLSLSRGVAVIDIPSAYDSSGTVRTTAITKRERSALDELIPGWRIRTGTPKHWCFDPDDPTAFDLSPAPTTQKIEVIYSEIPVDISSISDSIKLDDIYQLPMEAFLLFSWCSKSSDQGLQALAPAQWQLFQSLLGVGDDMPRRRNAAASARASNSTGAV